MGLYHRSAQDWFDCCLYLWRLLFKLLAIPMGQGGAGFIGALEEFQQRLLR